MLRVKAGPIIKGALTFVPGMTRLLPEAGGATASAKYCYGVWLKHLTMLWANGVRTRPRTIAELGPGSSLGTGLAALLSGAEHYLALDVQAHSDTATNLEIFDELLDLFLQRAPRPAKGWPEFDDCLDAQLFPAHILTEPLLAKTLAPARVARIRQAISLASIAHPPAASGIMIRYMAPWSDASVIEPNSVDLIFSHAVLAQVDDLERTYQALNKWLRPGGVMSHQIGFEFSGFDGRWNGYWAYPDALWKIIRGKRLFSINRQPASAHISLMRAQGLDLISVQQARQQSGLQREELAAPWQNLSDDDLNCSDLYVVAKKPMPSLAAVAL
jgi:SAM-dependent methyltransferase